MRNIRAVLWSALALVAMAAVWVSGPSKSPFAAARERALDTIIADFELTDHRGMVRTEEDFRGRWMLIFFGFTQCPDICPIGLATIAQVMDDLGAQAGAVQPIFISIDPERDTPNVMAEYVPRFGPGIIGLVGTPEQIKVTAKNFKIYYQETAEASALDGYKMSHTSSFLLFNPNGEFVRTYEYNQEPDQIVSELLGRI